MCHGGAEIFTFGSRLTGGSRRQRIVDSVRRMRRARRVGLGVYTNEWRYGLPHCARCPEPIEVVAGFAGPAGDGEESPVDVVVEAVLGWCRETLGASRRPWGIDQFDLALAVGSEEGARSIKFERLSPLDLYASDGLVQQLRTFFAGHARAEVSSAVHAMHVAAALFSWGDAADAALPSTA